MSHAMAARLAGGVFILECSAPGCDHHLSRWTGCDCWRAGSRRCTPHAGHRAWEAACTPAPRCCPHCRCRHEPRNCGNHTPRHASIRERGAKDSWGRPCSSVEKNSFRRPDAQVVINLIIAPTACDMGTIMSGGQRAHEPPIRIGGITTGFFLLGIRIAGMAITRHAQQMFRYVHHVKGFKEQGINQFVPGWSYQCHNTLSSVQMHRLCVLPHAT